MRLYFKYSGSGEIEFEEFAAMVANFVVASEDNEGFYLNIPIYKNPVFKFLGLEDELREAFRLYDKEVSTRKIHGFTENFNHKN